MRQTVRLAVVGEDTTVDGWEARGCGGFGCGFEDLAMLLTEEERQAVLEDARTPLMEFVKQEASGMVVMSMPLIFVVLVEQLPNVAMMAMLGQIDPVHSTEILAACGIAGIFQTVVLSGVVSGLGGALDTVCAQAYGAKRYAEF